MTYHLAVEPGVLRAAGNVLLETEIRVRQTDVDIQADTIPAARAFDGWRSGKALADLAGFWHQEFIGTAGRAGELGSIVIQAVANYLDADALAVAKLAPDHTYTRGR